MKGKRCLLILGVIAMAIILFGCGKQKPVPETTKDLGTGGKIDNTDISAPKAINSKNIVSFDTTFYIEKNDFLEGGYSGFYHFTIKDNVLSEDAQLNLSGKIEQPVLDELQKIIEKYDLVKKNGIDCYTAGVAPEYAPCYFKAGYDSGEQLYFKEDNDPLAKWAEEVFELFRKAFIEMGYEQLKLFEKQTSETVAGGTQMTSNGVLTGGGGISNGNSMPGGNRTSDNYIDGGTQDSLNPGASKTIQSEDITYFEVSSDFQIVADAVKYRYVYGYAAEVKDGVLVSVICKKDGSSSQDDTYQKTELVDREILNDIEKIVRNYEFAKQNGYTHNVNGLPQSFGGYVDICYSSGESIYFSDNQSPVISPAAGGEIADLIQSYIADRTVHTPDCSDIVSVRYREDQGNGCYVDYYLEGDKLQSESRYGEGEDMLFKDESTVPAGSMEKVRQIAAEGKLLSWEGIREVPDAVFPERTEQVTFQLKDGNKVTINGNMKAPGAADKSIFNIQMYLRYELGK